MISFDEGRWKFCCAVKEPCESMQSDDNGKNCSHVLCPVVSIHTENILYLSSRPDLNKGSLRALVSFVSTERKKTLIFFHFVGRHFSSSEK